MSRTWQPVCGHDMHCKLQLVSVYNVIYSPYLAPLVLQIVACIRGVGITIVNWVIAPTNLQSPPLKWYRG